MTECNSQMLTSYVDGALTGAEARLAEAHLALCSACAATATSHRDIKRLLATRASAVTVPVGLAMRIGSTLDRLPPPQPPSLIRGLGWGAKMGFLAVIATTGLWLARPIWQPPPLDIQSITFHHLHTLNPPADTSLATNNVAQARQWLQARTGEASSAPPLRIAMAGVGVCDVAGAPAVIWMYRAPEAISVIEVGGRYSLPDWPEVNERFRTGVYGGYNTVLWQTNGRTYAMVSRIPHDRMLSLVEHLP